MPRWNWQKRGAVRADAGLGIVRLCRARLDAPRQCPSVIGSLSLGARSPGARSPAKVSSFHFASKPKNGSPVSVSQSLGVGPPGIQAQDPEQMRLKQPDEGILAERSANAGVPMAFRV
jgi:hypothetical protein